MTTARVDESEVLDSARSVLVGRGDGETKILDVALTLKEDESGEDGWWVTLFLPRPAGEGWSAEATRDIKRSARRAFDEVADERGWSLAGPTVVLVSTRDAPPSQVAPDEELNPDAGLASGYLGQ